MRRLALAFGLLTAAVRVPCQATAETAAPEPRVKAAFIYNFLRFTEWPGSEATGPIRVGVVGSPAVVATLREELEPRTVSDRAIIVQAVTNDAEVRDKSVLYIASSDSALARHYVEATAGRPVLTITECDRFVSIGSLINFFLSEDTVHFAVNATQLERSSVKLSSQMLQYASLVKADAP